MHLALPELPVLQTLDVARNDHDALDLTGRPSLESLRSDRNRLAALELGSTPALRYLDCNANFLATLDLSPAPALVRVDARANQLSSLDLGEHTDLTFLDVSDNRLTALDVRSAPKLQQLLCAGNQLAQLDISGLRDLCQLHASINALDAIDLQDAEALADLKIAGNPLTELDILGNPELCRLRTDLSQGLDHPEVHATELQRQRLMELRRHHKLGSGASELAEMTAFELHDRAIGCQGDPSADRVLLDIVLQPQCDLGTALLAYWVSNPRYFLRFARREDCEPYERTVWDILRTVEDRFERGDLPPARIWFDPRNDKQTASVTGMDWTARQPRSDAPAVRSIPERLLEPSLPRPMV